MPLHERVDERRVGQPEPGERERGEEHDGDAGERGDAAQAGRVRQGRGGGACPIVVSISACGEAEEAEREQERRRGRGPGAAGLEAAGHDQHLADEERRGRQPGERAERDAHRRAEPGAACGRCPVTAWPAARGSCPRSGVAA